MFSAAPQMKRCPDCKAPNPPSQAQCYACGQFLDFAPQSIVSDGPTVACTNCAAQVPVSTSICPGCGRIAAPPFQPTIPLPLPSAAASAVGTSRTPLPPSVPMGWISERTFDGTTRLRRTLGGRLLRDVSTPIALVGLAFFIASLGAPGRHNPSLVTALSLLCWTLAACLLVGSIVALVWAVGSREELIVGPDFMAHRRYLGNYEQKWRVTGPAVLRVTTQTSGSEWGKYGKQTIRSLIVEQGAFRKTIDRRGTETSSWGVSHRTLASHLADFLSEHKLGDEMTRLAQYLAAQTGWQTQDDFGGSLSNGRWS